MTATVSPVKEKETGVVMPPSVVKAKSWPKLLLESFVAVVAVIAIVEALFAMAGVGEQEYLRVDPVLGFVPMEGKHVTWRKEGCGHIQFNSKGCNDIEHPYAKPANTYRVAIIGDSFVESLQVDRNQNFCSLLQESLNEKYGSATKHIEVMNFGCSANSLGQFYKKLNTQVFKYDPDLVMIDVSVDATKLLAPIQGGFAFANARPTFTLDKAGNLVEDWQVYKWWNKTPDGKRFAQTAFLREHSRIWGAIGVMMGGYTMWYQDLLAGKVWGWGAAIQAPAPTSTAASSPAPTKVAKAVEKPAVPKPGSYNAFNNACGGSNIAASVEKTEKTKIALPQAQGDVEGATKLYWPVAEKLIRTMNADCLAHNCKFAVLHLPARPEIGYDNPLETRNLEALCRSISLPYMDLTDAFVNAPKTVSLIYSVHMTPAGHRVANRELIQFFERFKLAEK